jgi:hypothetical protein
VSAYVLPRYAHLRSTTLKRRAALVSRLFMWAGEAGLKTNKQISEATGIGEGSLSAWDRRKHLPRNERKVNLAIQVLKGLAEKRDKSGQISLNFFPLTPQERVTMEKWSNQRIESVRVACEEILHERKGDRRYADLV